jgi:hypothetical protein
MWPTDGTKRARYGVECRPLASRCPTISPCGDATSAAVPAKMNGQQSKSKSAEHWATSQIKGFGYHLD